MHELKRAIVDLGLKGVTVSSQVNGLSLDAKEFTPFYDLIQKLDVPIFVHPALAPKGYSLMNDYQLPVILTREFDLGVAVTRLIAGGVIERYPDLNLSLPTSAADWPATKSGSRARRIVSSWLNRSKSISTGSTSIWPGSKAVRSHCAARLKVFVRSAWFLPPTIRRISITAIPSKERASTASANIIEEIRRLPLAGTVKEAMLGQNGGEIVEDRKLKVFRRLDMLRIKGMSKEEASEETRKIFDEQEKQYGSILNTAKVYGLRPMIQKGVQALQAGILESGLISGDLRHLLCMKAASINGCPY